MPMVVEEGQYRWKTESQLNVLDPSVDRAVVGRWGFCSSRSERQQQWIGSRNVFRKMVGQI